MDKKEGLYLSYNSSLLSIPPYYYNAERSHDPYVSNSFSAKPAKLSSSRKSCGNEFHRQSVHCMKK